jgi:hypothetical protein
MKTISNKGMTSQTLVVFVLVLIVLALSFGFFPGMIKNLSATLIGASEDQVDKAVGNVKLPDLPAPDVPTTAPTTNPVQGTLSGSNLAEKAVYAAKEAGLTKEEAGIVLKLISQESNFRHCCAQAGKNTAGTCKSTDEVVCEENRVLISFDGSSTGAMQLNKNVHKPWFTTDETELCSQSKYKSVCRIKENAGCMGKTAFDLDCNIRMGIGLLQAYKNQYGSGKKYVCNGVDTTYTGWDAGLRGYVGWGCDTFHYNYVSQVNARDSIVTKYQPVLDKVYSS